MMKIAKLFRPSCTIIALTLFFSTFPAEAAEALASFDATKPTVIKRAPWPAITVNLTADPIYQWISHQSTLTATTNYDVGPTPYYISIYYTGSSSESGGSYENSVLLQSCSTGTTCSIKEGEHLPVENTPVAATYKAFVASYPPAFDYPEYIVASDIVNVTFHGGGAKLKAGKPTTTVGGNAVTLTATSTLPVEQVYYHIMIFDETTGQRLAYCSSGTTCMATVSQSQAATHKYMSYIGLGGTSLPVLYASKSPPIYVTWSNAGYEVALSYKYVSGQVEFTATANKSVTGTGNYISVYNLTTGQRAAICGIGSVCKATYNYKAGTSYAAFIATSYPYDGFCPPNNIVANSATYQLH